MRKPVCQRKSIYQNQNQGIFKLALNSPSWVKNNLSHLGKATAVLPSNFVAIRFVGKELKGYSGFLRNMCTRPSHRIRE